MNLGAKNSTCSIKPSSFEERHPTVDGLRKRDANLKLHVNAAIQDVKPAKLLCVHRLEELHKSLSAVMPHCIVESDDHGATAELNGPHSVLPALHFSYNERPPETFTGRWIAIEHELTCRYASDQRFSIVDVGCNRGYFCLNAALRYPAAFVIGVEGATGEGNGRIGNKYVKRISNLGGFERELHEAELYESLLCHIVQTEAVVTHLSWMAKLAMSNCAIAPEVWDLDRIIELRQQGFYVDVMLSLSVVHHMDRISQACVQSRGLDPVRGSLELIVQLLHLADLHVIELPAEPWKHMRDAFKTSSDILREAISLVNDGLGMRLIYCNDWVGQRELWLIERRCKRVDENAIAKSKNCFHVLLPGKPWTGAPLLAHVMSSIRRALSERDKRKLQEARNVLRFYQRQLEGENSKDAGLSEIPCQEVAQTLESVLCFASAAISKKEDQMDAAWRDLTRPAGAGFSCALNDLHILGSSGKSLADLIADVRKQSRQEGHTGTHAIYRSVRKSVSHILPDSLDLSSLGPARKSMLELMPELPQLAQLPTVSSWLSKNYE